METNSNNLAFDREAAIVEYEKLKDEIIKRIQLRQQLLAITLTIMGVILTVAIQNNKPEIALIYPPIAAIMALLWIQNDGGIRYAAGYICQKIEKKIPTIGYEKYKIEIRATGGWRSLTLFASHGGVFFFTQILTVVVALHINDSLKADIRPLLNISYLCIIIVLSLYLYWWLSGKPFRTIEHSTQQKKPT